MARIVKHVHQGPLKLEFGGEKSISAVAGSPGTSRIATAPTRERLPKKPESYIGTTKPANAMSAPPARFRKSAPCDPPWRCMKLP